MNCSIAQALEVIGDRWTLLILRDAFRGVSRFDDFQQLGIARNVLQQRLEVLVDNEVLVKVPYSDRPLRFDYQLSDKGRDVWPVLQMLYEWGEAYCETPGERIEFSRPRCGHQGSTALVCATCSDPIDSDTTRLANSRTS